ncbi:hypothetical protein [Candidatus Methylacidiphilum infernorum]|uniref:hypothetical protein n=1 Tax=Candidatus Methylacidiphilum infernorum TaxID=511746 RepID=UPI0011D0F3E9|nr:hypothetical protein [Candidatus Methylacidiphilum infernorum]
MLEVWVTCFRDLGLPWVLGLHLRLRFFSLLSVDATGSPSFMMEAMTTSLAHIPVCVANGSG